MYFAEYLGSFAVLFELPETYGTLIFCMFAFVLWDAGVEHTRLEI